MAFADYVKAFGDARKASKERKLAKKRQKSIKETSDIMGIYAENAVRKFKAEYMIQSEHGKRMCTVPIDPYPDEAVMKRIWRLSKKDYLIEFEIILAEKLAEHGFSDFSISANPFNTKCSVILKVKW